jgi:iron complex transport system substrate-binding protein
VLEGEWAQSLPATVTSRDLDGDREVTVERADRVIGLDLAGSIAATIVGLGLGDRLVGRDVSSDLPGLGDLPIVTSNGHTVNSEAIIALAPDVVITDGTIGPVDVLQQLRDAGISVVFVDAESSLRGAGSLAEQVGAALGMADAGAALADQLTAAIDAKVAEIAGIVPAGEPLRVLFLYLRGTSGIYYLFGEGSGADAIIAALGATDVAAEVGIVGSRPMTDEAMIAAAPDLILVMSGGLESMGGIDGMLDSLTAVALTPAGENRRIVDMADAAVLSFGPRTPAVLDALARAVYAPEIP